LPELRDKAGLTLHRRGSVPAAEHNLISVRTRIPDLRPFWLFGLAFLLITLATITYGLSQGISWVGLAPSPCYPGCFCEAFQRAAIVQPLSSYSNLGYVLVGLGIMASTRISLLGDGKRTNLLLRKPTYIILYGLVAIFIGLTSFFYHVSLTLVGRWVDYMGMYALVSFGVAYNLTRLGVVRGRMFAFTFIGFNISLAIPMMAVSSLEFKRALLLGMILAIIGLEGIIHLIRRPTRLHVAYFFAALGVLAAATVVNLLDESGQWCSHTSLWQWHAVWHFLTAVSISLLFLYYRTEDDSERQFSRH
jgi:hypothetical protein